MAEPAISVLMPVLNSIRFIGDTLASIFAQTLPPLEVIVVDDASTDGTSDFLASYPDARLRHVLRTGQRNIYSAWNHAIALAQGELLAFVSADDLWLPDKLALQAARMIAEPDLQYTCTYHEGFIDPVYPPPPEYVRANQIGIRTGVLMETMMARPSLFTQQGAGFFEDYQVSGDVEWFARQKARQVPFAMIEQALTRKRLHDDNTSARDPDLTRAELLKALLGAARERSKK